MVKELLKIKSKKYQTRKNNNVGFRVARWNWKKSRNKKYRKVNKLTNIKYKIK